MSDTKLQYQYPYGTLLLFTCESDKGNALKFFRAEQSLQQEQILHMAIQKNQVLLATRSKKLYQLDLEKNSVKQVPQFDGMDISHLEAGDVAGLIIVQQTRVFTFGDNYCGMLGLGDMVGHDGIVEVPFFKQGQHKIVHAAVGYCHIVVVDSNGESFSWALGLSTAMKQKVAVPTKNLLNGNGIVKIVTKGFYTFVMYANRDIWCYGNNAIYELGLGHGNPVPAPIKHEKLSQLHVKDIFPWFYGGFAITYDDQMYVWGLQTHLDCFPLSTSTNIPVLCQVLSNKHITNVYMYLHNVFFSSITNTSYSYCTDTSNRKEKPYPLHTTGIQNIVMGDIADDYACLVLGPIHHQSLFANKTLRSKLQVFADCRIVPKQ